jgi:putative RecB family exonuclease
MAKQPLPMLPLSATRLTTFSRCPRAYYFRYEQKAPGKPVRAALLGRSIHEALAQFHQWPGWRGMPSLAVLQEAWIAAASTLPETQEKEGWQLLKTYYQKFVEPLEQWREPLATEGRLEGTLQAGPVEFKLGGRYDRLDTLRPDTKKGGGATLAVTDYKTSRTVLAPDQLAMDIQMGLYQIALNQRYQGSLAQVNHIYLRTGDIVQFEAHEEQQVAVKTKIQSLACALMEDKAFVPKEGEHCRSCEYRKFCPAIHERPESLPKQTRSLQLSLLSG